MLDLGELLLVKTPMEVILRVTVVVKKMMVVMKHWVLLQQLPANTTTKNVPTIAEKNKTQVLTTAWREFLKQPRENTPTQENPVVPGAALQVHGGQEKQRRESLMLWKISCLAYICTLEISLPTAVQRSTTRIRQMYAPKHEMKKFHPNFKRLIESKIAMKGPFEMKAKVSKEIEPRYTSSKNTSLAYTLLHDMYRFNTSKINSMKAEDIWKSHPQFRQYPINDFKKYNKNMKILVSKKVMRAAK